MKNKLIFMIFAVSLLLNISCTSDDYDNQGGNATVPKNTKLIPSNATENTNLKVIDSLGTNSSLLLAEPDGDPSNPKPIN